MATTHRKYFPTHPGRDGGICPADFHFSPASASRVQDPCGFMAANTLGELFCKNVFPMVSPGTGYNANLWTTTATGTGAAVADSSAAGGGILLTTGSTSTENTNLQSLQIWAPLAGKPQRIVGLARVIPLDITLSGFEFSFGTSAVNPMGTDYTDAVSIRMLQATPGIIGKVRGSSGAGVRLGIPKAASTNTAVTTGASSATQTLTTTSNISAGDCLYFVTTAAYRQVASVTNGTVVVLDLTVSTTTAEVVKIFAPLYTAAAATEYFVGFQVGVLSKGVADTTVTTGASSTTQTVGSTANMAVGDLVYFVTTAKYRQVLTIPTSTTFTTVSVSTTSAEVVKIFVVDGGFWAGTDIKSALYTPFNADCVTQIGLLFGQTSVPSMYMNLNAKGTTTTSSVQFASALFTADTAY